MHTLQGCGRMPQMRCDQPENTACLPQLKYTVRCSLGVYLTQLSGRLLPLILDEGEPAGCRAGLAHRRFSPLEPLKAVYLLSSPYHARQINLKFTAAFAPVPKDGIADDFQCGEFAARPRGLLSSAVVGCTR